MTVIERQLSGVGHGAVCEWLPCGKMAERGRGRIDLVVMASTRERAQLLNKVFVPGSLKQSHVAQLALRGKYISPILLAALLAFQVHRKARQHGPEKVGLELTRAARILRNPDFDVAAVAPRDPHNAFLELSSRPA